MIITARLITPQTNVGYQFYDAAGSLIASRITAGIVALPEPGSYQANSSPPANAVGVFWDCDAAGVTAQASLITRLPDATITKLNAAEQIILTETFIPTDAPVLIIPLPDPDPAFTIVFGFTSNFIGVVRAGIDVTLRPSQSPSKANKILEQSEITATTDAEGYFEFRVLTGVSYLATSDMLGLARTFIAPIGTYNLDSIIL